MLYIILRGEVFGLKIGSIDIEKRQFKVVEQLSSSAELERSGRYTAPPKVKASVRTLPITDYTLAGRLFPDENMCRR